MHGIAGNNWRAGLWGWMIDRSCAPTTHHPGSAGAGNHQPYCNETTTISVPIRRDNDTMYVSPVYAKGSVASHSKVYAARDSRWYQSQFPVAAEQCPVQLIVGAVNDYTEMNCWWPSLCPNCETGGEAADPYLFWNVTVAGLEAVHSACDGRAP